MPKEINHSRKGSINIQNSDDSKCFEWCLVRYLYPAGHHSARIRKIDKDFARKLDFKDINFPVKIRDIHKIEKKNLSALVFLVMKIRNNSQSTFQKMLLRNMSRYT